MNVQVDKKFILTWSTIASLSLALLGFVGAQYFDVLKNYTETIKENQTELRILKQKVDDDASQWQILKKQDENIHAQEVEIKVLKILVKKMSEEKDKQIIIRIEGDPLDIKPSKIKPTKSATDPVEDAENALKEIEEKMKRMSEENKGDYHDFRKEQMMRQHGFKK